MKTKIGETVTPSMERALRGIVGNIRNLLTELDLNHFDHIVAYDGVKQALTIKASDSHRVITIEIPTHDLPI